MEAENSSEQEIKSWLEVILKNKNLKKFSVKIEGTTGKGDGYLGDILFVDVKGTTKEGNTRDYNLVLKCAKRSAALREKSPVKEAFYNEIFFYNTIFPRFLQFQKEKNIDNPFDKVPKCYGSLVKGDMEILALENLKKRGYILWDRKTPLTRKHVDMIIEGYAIFHAVSIVMEKEQPKELRQMAEPLVNVMAKFFETGEWLNGMEITIEELYDLLKNEMEEDVMLKWRNLKNDVRPFFATVKKEVPELNVIIHGDCWNNNFMHYHIDNKPETFVMLDWQLTRYSSPILDLTYFLFTCISKEDINDLDIILQHYHETLVIQLRKLGIANPESVYPLEQFFIEWKKYCKLGVFLAMILHKASVSDNDDVPDIAEAAERGEDISKGFSQPVTKAADYKKRMSYIIKYIAEHNLI